MRPPVRATLGGRLQPRLKEWQWFKGEHIEVMQWPSQSPDLNPIENT